MATEAAQHPTGVDDCNAGIGHSAPEENEPCPAPLAWQQVLQAFRSESRAWEIDRGPYVLRGRTWGEGQPLYFLNGLGGTSELFALMVWLLHDNFRCVVYDYPAADSASVRHVRLTVKSLSEDMFAVADFHDDHQFQVFATSFGSAVALWSMLEQPERIERAIIQAGFAHRGLTLCERMLFRVGRFLPGSLRNVPLRQHIQRQSHQPWFPPYDFTRWQFFLDNTGDVAISSLAQRAAVLTDLDLRSRLPEIEQPVLLVRSEGDGRIAKRSQDELEQGLVDCHSEQLHTSGQLPYLTHPHRLAKLLRSFLLEVDDTVVEAVVNP